MMGICDLYIDGGVPGLHLSFGFGFGVHVDNGFGMV